MADPDVSAAIAVVQQQPVATAEESGLARELAVPLLAPSQLSAGSCRFFVRFDEDCLGLYRNPPGQAGAVTVDFSNPRLRHRVADRLRRQPLLKAAGIKAGHLPLVLDATAGLGRDAYLFASAGCQVLMMEREPLMHALLRDGLRRGIGLAGDEAAAVARLSLQFGDFLVTEPQLKAIDVVYLDPMFPEQKQRALVKKELQLLRELLGAQCGAGMLDRARSLARRRVVVKRGRKSPSLDQQTPDFSFTGRSNRYDVYLA